VTDAFSPGGQSGDQSSGRPAGSTATPLASSGSTRVTVRTATAGADSGPTAMPAIPAMATLRACTVATRAELPAVRVLSTSFVTAHPDAGFAALIVDAEPDDSGPGLLTPGDIGVDQAELAYLATAHTAERLCAVLRPRLLAHLLAEGSAVLYLDPWTLVLGPFDDHLLPAVAHSGLTLIPRVLRPLPDDGLRPNAEELLAAGVYDPGFLAVATGAEPFLDAWAEQTRRAPGSVDSFLDGAPALVDHHVLRERGIGLSVWNAAQRELTRSGDDRVLVDGAAPLRTINFAGFDPRRPWLLSAEVTDRPRVLLSEHPVLAELCAAYRNRLVRAGHGTDEEPYRFAVLPDGTDIPDPLRTEFHAAWAAAERTGDAPPPPAFGSDGGAFLTWAGEAVDGQPGSTRWAAAVWRADPELCQRFPDPFGTDAAAFRDWCAGPGVEAGRVRPDLVPGPGVAEPALLDQFGVAVLGRGRVSDLVRAAARAAGLPTSDVASYPVVLDCGGGARPPTERYVISYRLDAATVDPAGTGEVWVPSESTRELIESAGDRSAYAVPLPVLDPGERDEDAQAAARQRWDVAADAVVLACLADHAVEQAGNALGVVSAFLDAFADRSNVMLLIPVTGAAEHPEAAERLRLATSADRRIRLVEEATDQQRRDIFDAADCVVSLHKGGAHGCADRAALVLTDAVARGVPVVTSDDGVLSALLDASSAVLVPSYPGSDEPDVEAAGVLLATLLEDRQAAAKLGLAAREALLRERALGRVAERLRDRVEHAYRGWRARRAVSRPEAQADPLAPLHAARHALLRRPDVSAASRTPMAPALRKAVLRVLSHYDHHVREVLSTLVDGIERTATELVHQQQLVREGSGVDEWALLRAELEELADRQNRLDDTLTGTDDGVVRVRADIAGLGRRLREAEDAVVNEAAKRGQQVETLAERIDKLTGALDRTLDRIDSLEETVAEVLRERDRKLESGMRTAAHALQTADALRRVVVREHERHGAAAPSVRSSVVVCDAGLLRLPAEDGVMLPLLSSNGVWEPELSALIDSLVEPGGIFVDVGAYVGYHTVRVASRLGTSGAVVAVEPCATAATLLRHNVEVNVPPAAAQRLVLLDAAAWDTSGPLLGEDALTGGLTVHPASRVENHNSSPDVAAGDAADPTDSVDPPPDGQASDTTEGDQAHTVRAVRLDKELEGMPALDGLHLSVVRVDVPGRGHRALGGLVRLLRRDRPHVFCQFSPGAMTEFGDDPAVVLREFRTWGYELMLLDGQQSLSPDELLAALDPARATTLWLRPKTRAS
jgi:FkbM family methyltransferase